jgi:hypothetical protein
MPPSIGWNGTSDTNGGLVTGTDQSDAAVEKFAPNGGTVVAVVGGLVVLALLVGWAIDIHDVPLVVPALALLCGVVVYISTLRPRVLVRGHDLVLRNMLTTVTVPLAAVEELAVRQVLAIRAGGRRYVCAGVGRSMRSAMKGSAAQKAREQMGGLRGELERAKVAAEPGMHYADYVEMRLTELVNEDRARRGIKRFSAEADELGRQVRREWARPELAALAGAAVLVVVGLVVG